MSRDASRGIPREAPECVPIGLVEVRAGPVAVRAHIRHAGHAVRAWPCNDPSITLATVEPGSLGEGIEAQCLFEQRAEVDEVRGESQVFLGDLHFEHQRCFRHGAEQRMGRLARLKVDGAVLDLQQHVAAKLAVERRELLEGLLGPSSVLMIGIHEGPPHDDAAVRRKRVGKHVGAVGVRASVVLRARLAFGIRLDDEAAEIGNVSIDLVDLVAPPQAHRRILGVGALEAAHFASVR